MEDATPARKKRSSVRQRARLQTRIGSPPATAAATAIRRLPLASLRVFVAVGEHLSFGRAADALGVTSGAASMQIRALEDYLRVPLFRRSGRHVALTRDRPILLAKVRRGLADLQQALDEARKDRAAGPVRLTTFASFLSMWLLPRLDRFTVRQPHLELEIHTSDEVVDFVKRDFQVGIRMGKGNWSGLHVEKLFEEWLVPMCRPDLLARLGPVHDADDLRRYRLLNNQAQMPPRFRAQSVQLQQGIADLAVWTELPRLMRIGHVETPVGEESVQLPVSDTNHRKFPLWQSLFVNRR
jgi:DNA-binding transcriptional LysR family regulator